MKQLKTLKDLENDLKIISKKSNKILFDGKMIKKDDLKSEAVKWIKIFEFDWGDCFDENGLIIDEEDRAKDALQKFIKHFFNITEKDLEDK